MILNRWLTDEEYARAAESGISKSALRRRVYDYGWDLEEALTAPPGSVRHEFERKHEKWLKVALKNGIKSSTFYSRLNLGWSYENAANKPVHKKNKTEKNWLEVALENGIRYQTFTSRVRMYGWDLERAATTPVMTARESGKKARQMKAIFTDEQLAKAKSNGVSRQVLRRRVVVMGWDLEEAMITPPLKTWNTKRKRNIS
nr:nucleoside permease [Bacillus pseudomycoides]